jgi:type II secretory pathway pseudopilin PulG
MRISPIKSKKAFGILEVTITAGIIVIVLAALTAASRSAMSKSQSVEARSQALYLAQEGLESIHQMRSTNWVGNLSNSSSTNQVSTNWDDMVYDTSLPMDSALLPIGPYLQTTNFFQIGFLSTNTLKRFHLTGISSSILDSLLYNIKIVDPGNTFYRYIKIENIGSDILPNDTVNNVVLNSSINKNAYKFTVVVGWKEGEKDKKVEISEILTDWKPKY